MRQFKQPRLVSCTVYNRPQLTYFKYLKLNSYVLCSNWSQNFFYLEKKFLLSVKSQLQESTTFIYYCFNMFFEHAYAVKRVTVPTVIWPCPWSLGLLFFKGAFYYKISLNKLMFYVVFGSRLYISTCFFTGWGVDSVD